MQRMTRLISSLLLIASTGFAEVLITAQDYAVDSDVVLESVLREIKSIPQDTVNMIGDSLKYVKDETVNTAKGAAAVFKGDPHAKAQKAGELAVENAWDMSNDILSRTYNLSEEIGNVLMTGSAAASGPSVDVSGFFESVEFSKKTSASYFPKFNRLFVRQTSENLLAIESVLADYQDGRRDLMGHQVEIETKFVEVNQSTLNELGFKWDFIGKGGPQAVIDGVLRNTGPASIIDDILLPAQGIFKDGLRTAASAINGGVSDTLTLTKTTGSLQWNLVINALEQSDDSDVLSAPRVVTRDGMTATIQVGEEQMIPTAFDVDNTDLSPWVEHTDWDVALMGVQLEVTPELREGGLIDLEIIPKIKELIGFDTYLVNSEYTYYNNSRYGGEGPAPAILPLEASLPYFRIREMETRVTVADGSTVGMGGLIYDKLETFRDKVPVLGSIPFIGRLFRSEGEKSVKRNLMIFVTATQVDVDGRRSSDIALGN